MFSTLILTSLLSLGNSNTITQNETPSLIQSANTAMSIISHSGKRVRFNDNKLTIKASRPGKRVRIGDNKLTIKATRTGKRVRI